MCATVSAPLRARDRLLGDMDVLGLVDPSGHEHHAEDHHQDRQNDAADHEDRARVRRGLKLIKTESRSYEADHG